MIFARVVRHITVEKVGNRASDSIDLHGVASWLHEGALRQNSRDFIIAAIEKRRRIFIESCLNGNV